MAIALLIGRNIRDQQHFSYFINEVTASINSTCPDVEVRVYPDLGDSNDIDFAIAWRPPLGIFTQLPNLKCIASLGAGVDHIFADSQLPAHIPIVRIVDPNMAVEITQYVVATVLYWLKRFDTWAANQQRSLWGKNRPFNFLDKTVGVMGLGFLGKRAAETLQALGVKVIGWSHSHKHITTAPTFTGVIEFKDFLAQSSALVCLLPLTSATKNILNAGNFALLPRGAYLINLGRGEHLVEADLLSALASGQLSGACLDVFRQEPLPEDHPFWQHPQIRITPHIASVTNIATALPQILDNYRRAMSGEPLLNQVDFKKEY